MIRVGASRWFVAIAKYRQEGRTRYDLGMVPQARKYVVLDSAKGEVEVCPRELKVSSFEDTWESSSFKHDAVVCARLAEELAGDAVDHCERTGILQGGHDKRETIYIVKIGLIQHSQRQEQEPLERVEVISLAADQRAVLEASARHEMDLELAHVADMKLRQAMTGEALAASMRLLYDHLTEDELKEAKRYGTVTVKTDSGDFVVPVASHGLIRQYVDNEYVQSYCAAAYHYDIPVGDEALMKIIYLKNALGKLVKTANKFKERNLERLPRGHLLGPVAE